jgi:hypothetical protein
MAKLNSFRDLKVYQKLKALHLEVHLETLRFPKFESYELGSQVRGCINLSVNGRERHVLAKWSVKS